MDICFSLRNYRDFRKARQDRGKRATELEMPILRFRGSTPKSAKIGTTGCRVNHGKSIKKKNNYIYSNDLPRVLLHSVREINLETAAKNPTKKKNEECSRMVNDMNDDLAGFNGHKLHSYCEQFSRNIDVYILSLYYNSPHT
ncbi:hypothetical protein P5V15_010583 [Pogonomyrmex californicus]